MTPHPAVMLAPVSRAFSRTRPRLLGASPCSSYCKEHAAHLGPRGGERHGVRRCGGRCDGSRRQGDVADAGGAEVPRQSRASRLASPRSAGMKLPFRGGELVVQVASPKPSRASLRALQRGGARSRASSARSRPRAGAVVIDNSSAWRMDPSVPLVVPEVNMEAALSVRKGIIANPNCSTIQMVVALKPLHDAATHQARRRVDVPGASGKGHAAVEELLAQTRALVAGEHGRRPAVFPGRIAFNVLWTGSPATSDYSEEEWKMVHETRKILGDATHRRLADDGARARRERAQRVGARPVPPADDRRGGGDSLLAQRRGRHPRRRARTRRVTTRSPSLRPAPTGLRRPRARRSRGARRHQPLDRRRQPPQGRGAQRRADRRTYCC